MRRRQREQQGADSGDGDRGSDDAPVEPEIEIDRIHGGADRQYEHVGGPSRDEDAKRRTAGGQERAFDRHLLDEPRARSADGETQAKLRLADRGAREHEIGEVRRGNQQNADGDGHQHPERPFVLRAQRRHARAAVDRLQTQRLITLRHVGSIAWRQRLLEDPGTEARQMVVCLGQRRAGSQPAHHRRARNGCAARSPMSTEAARRRSAGQLPRQRMTPA